MTEQAEEHVVVQDLVAEDTPLGTRSRGLVRALVALGERPTGVGDPEELEMIVAIDFLVDASEQIVDGLGTLHRVNVEGRDALHLHGGDEAECADAGTRGREHLRLMRSRALDDLTLARDQPHSDDPRREIAEACSRAVRRRLRRAGDRLVGDVAQVLEGQPVSDEVMVEARQGNAGLDGDGAIGRIDLQHLLISATTRSTRRR